MVGPAGDTKLSAFRNVFFYAPSLWKSWRCLCISYPLFEFISRFFVILDFTLADFNGWLFEPVQFIWSDWKPESWEMLNELFTSSTFVNIDSNSRWYCCDDISWSCCLYDTLTQTQLHLTWWNQQRHKVFQRFRNPLLSIYDIINTWMKLFAIIYFPYFLLHYFRCCLNHILFRCGTFFFTIP